MKSISFVSTVRLEVERCKNQVCRLLGWTEMEMVDFQLDSGKVYLLNYVGEKWAADMIQNSHVFWSWWLNHWYSRDKEFLVYSGMDLLDRRRKVTLYLLMHDGRELSRSIRPSAVILQDSYARMVQEMIDNQKNETDVTKATGNPK